MTCRKVRKLIPLAAGGDLVPRREASLLAHLDRCQACRGELETFRSALAEVRAAARADGATDWADGEWRALMARVTAAAERAGRPASQPAVARRPLWATAAVAGALLSLVVMGVLFRSPSPRREIAAAEASAPQDKVAVHLVSPESGLQIVWILDKNFDWKGDHE
jgi:hypothetical protein